MCHSPARDACHGQELQPACYKGLSMDLARAVSRPFRAGFAVAAGGLLAASCATGAPGAPASPMDIAGMVSQPAPRSTLVSTPALRFSVAQNAHGAPDMVVLVYEPRSGARIP